MLYIFASLNEKHFIMNAIEMRNGNVFTFIENPEVNPDSTDVFQLQSTQDPMDRFAPILLNEEWIKACGFEFIKTEVDEYDKPGINETVHVYRYQTKRKPYYEIEVHESNPIVEFCICRNDFDNYILKEIQYVHELQNIMYELTGINFIPMKKQ